ncbi:MAG: hypothetical protein JXA97_06325 [Anaerolineales bacterium]|nr:hypothetical protein [Anaerolineales bacterium]
MQFPSALYLCALFIVGFTSGCGQSDFLSPSTPSPEATSYTTEAPAPTIPINTPAIHSDTAAPAPTPSPPRSLEAYLASRDLELWVDGEAVTRHPITTDMFLNPELYAPFWAAFEEALTPAMERAGLLEANGFSALADVHWNGVSSDVLPVEVDVFLRDAENPESVLWTGDSGGLVRQDVYNLGWVAAELPAELPMNWEEPGRFVYLDDPYDAYAEGLHIVDAANQVIAFWNPVEGKPEVWRQGDNGRAELVNGFDLPFIGFNEEELTLLWEAFFWIRAGYPGAEEQFLQVDAVRRSELERYQAGAATQAYILLSSQSFSMFQDEMHLPRSVDVLAVAGYLVHEVTHVNQDAVCTQAYAESQGMTLEEYALYLETGPGQAYDSEAAFLHAVLMLVDEDGFLIQNPIVRDMIEQYAVYRARVVGRDAFPNGERVPTCAQSVTGTAP